MTDSYQKGSITYVKRRENNLPSVKRHAVRAALLTIVVAAGLGVGYSMLGDQHDAIARGEVGIERAPLPVESSSLDGSGTDLPDLLQGVVAEGVNPTEQLDALGNSINGNSSGGGLAGGDAPVKTEQLASVRPVSTGPKTILIDGKPLDGSGYQAGMSLPRAPFADIVRTSPWGPIPIISPSGNKALNAYARPFNPTPGRSQVSIVIGGLGIDRNLTRRIINELPPEVTLSFAAHTNGLQTWIHQARERGHEVMIELPMEGHNFNASEPGAGRALKVDAGSPVNIRNLDWLMSRAQGYFAVTNYNGGRLVQDQTAILPILQHLSNAGVGFVYDGSTDAPVLPGLAAGANLDFESAYTIIDSHSNFTMIQSELGRLEVASTPGNPQIGIGFALPDTLLAVKSWVNGLEAKGFELAPASYALNR